MSQYTFLKIGSEFQHHMHITYVEFNRIKLTFFILHFKWIQLFCINQLKYGSLILKNASYVFYKLTICIIC